MASIEPLDSSASDPAPPTSRERVPPALSVVPNLHATLAKAPTALEGLLQLDEANASGRLTPREREIIALAVSQANGSHYCLSVHATHAKRAGLTPRQIRESRTGGGTSCRDAAIAGLVLALIETRGHVPRRALAEFKAAGLDEADVLEIVANVAAMTIKTFASNVARIALDYPPVEIRHRPER